MVAHHRSTDQSPVRRGRAGAMLDGRADMTAHTQPSDARRQAAERRGELVQSLRAAGALACPEALPLAARRDDLLAAIGGHQVVIVAGETGSGKSTQLPKICLDLGRGVAGLVGHTQPRRMAARTIAERVAEEMGTELGGAVGYTVRFTDTVGEQTLVKVMTDGILLAEIQRDRMLRRYDTLIIDEAHERSLNIDFLLGYLAQLLPQRPDLKLIVTSATIDTQRFSEHFANAAGVPAPIIEVSGRTFPVEVRYRPFGAREEDPDDDRDQVQAIVDGVDELALEGNGDVLVFLSGEREIHDTADALRRHFAATAAAGSGSASEVLPLYARLSAVEQHRIWQPHRGRRVVLATNVAETSLTVPGVRYVIDAGAARISRYSHRLKVQRLPIEAVSQASANQRAGRCGRVAPGVCIRLYDEEGFTNRPEFTEPEILRTNLASVILQMTALGLGDVAAFPFLDPPDSRAVRDGYSLLEELGAIEPSADGPAGDAARRLTPMGKRLARLPLDPRLGRMVLEAERHGCAREVIVIAAVLSIQDPRERPAEHRAAADELHRRFNVPGSDFLSLVKLWDYLREQQHELSSSQFRKLCRSEYLNYLRVREWQDLFSQLRQVAGQIGIRLGSPTAGVTAGHPDRVHQALLAGLLSHIGMRDGTTREYKGAHGSKFAVGQGSVLAKTLPRWVIAAELVETNRLWGRMLAEVQPEWAEQLGGHLAKRSYSEPRWDPKRGAAVCGERVSLFGLPIVSNRTIGYDRIDRAAAREMFIRCALVEGDWAPHGGAAVKFWEGNLRFLKDLAGWGERVRRPELVDSEAVFAFYDQRVGADVVSTRHFDRWWKQARASQPELLTMRMEHFVGGSGAASAYAFPTVWRHGEIELTVSYRFDPGAPLDGATVHVPLAVLNQVEPVGFDWGVPGFRDELVRALLRSLPKEHRRELVPMAEVAEKVATTLGAPERWEDGTSLAAALAAVVQEVTGVVVPPHAFDAGKVPPHLCITFAVDDPQGAPIATGTDILALRKLLAPRLRAAIAREAPIEERRGITRWDFGDLPREVSTERNGITVRGYPALLDDGDSVSIRVFTKPELQAKVMRTGVRRLLLLAVPVGKRAVEQHLTNALRLAIVRGGTGSGGAVAAVSLDSLADDCLIAAADRLVVAAGAPVFTAAEFDELVRVARDELPDAAAGALRTAAEIYVVAAAAAQRLDRLVAPPVAASATDARAQLDRLVRPGFVTATGTGRLADVLRYVKAIDHRLAKLPEDPHRDQARLREVVVLEARYVALLRRMDRDDITPELIDVGWLLEELRVATFAQQLGTARPASPQRVSKELAALGA
ncbi:MAG: ATP-dependent RNA helicase HrpA [Actinomycetota bacterium]|nr:ATP-dependent RNA helicase HrpA [Actinomycetota bacterium]